MNIDVNSQNNNVVTCEMLSQQITLVQDTLQAQATHAVNLALTARNWLIGYYIVNYEQHGADRAQYGAQLMSRLAKRINRRGLDARRLREFRLFYLAYPQLLSAVENYVLTNAEIGSRSDKAQIWRLPSAILQSTEIKEDVIWRMPSAKLEKWQTPPERLFRRLNYSNLLYLSSITDDLKRAFYEQEAIAGCWTVKELDRQVSSLYFERMGLSRDKFALRQYVEAGAGVVEQVSLDLQREFPGDKGFSSANLWFMKKWYLFYGTEDARQKLQQLVREMQSGHNKIDKKLYQVGREIQTQKLYQLGREMEPQKHRRATARAHGTAAKRIA